MKSKIESKPKYFVKRWTVIIGLFSLVQFIFIRIDGTSLEPNLNNNGKWILDATLFTEWIAPYSFAFFNLCLTIHVIAILAQLGHDTIFIHLIKKYR